jgi:TetR/AcrR family transcriptional regulator, regulator of cefoperazone and chloramphenicol sensitivity
MAVRDSDLTAAARIRDAALQLFAKHGVSAVSIRDVAKSAGVSAGAVQHHFQTKVHLQRAVEAAVVRRATEVFGTPIVGSTPSENTSRMGTRLADFIRDNPAVFAYVGRSLLEGDRAGTTLFQTLFRLVRQQADAVGDADLLRADLDRDWSALHLILINIGTYLFEPALRSCLGESPLTEKGLKRMERATEALFLTGVYRPEAQSRPMRKRTRGSAVGKR